ncbi:MAG: hypothetical protein OEZ65_13580 [Gemmatimonadota bacterium]|nr:hypothetical protein [Gemmatimonadota bacterium]MDH5760614.1 hypothetical protein [Gemmatimonadota bacterium]
MKWPILAATALVAVAACSAEGGDQATRADTLTRRQKDSIVAEMPLPGSKGVRRAIDASDQLQERADRLDSIG